MIHFFRDILDGPIYIIVVIISLIIIMGIIGFIMERYQKEKEEGSVVKEVNAAQPQVASTLVISSTPNTKEPDHQQPQEINGKESISAPLPTVQQTTPEPPLNPLPMVEISSVKETPPTATISSVPTIIETPVSETPSTIAQPTVLELNSNNILNQQQVPVTQENNIQNEQSVNNVAPVIDFGSTTDVDVATK